MKGSHPDRVDLDLPDRRLAESCRSHSVGFLPLRRHLAGDHYFDHDMHWNVRGHRTAARIVSDWLTSPGPSAIGRER